MKYWVIEHYSKGVLTDVPGDRDEKYHFQWSKPYGDEVNKRFFNEEAAQRVADTIEGTLVVEVETFGSRDRIRRDT